MLHHELDSDVSATALATPGPALIGAFALHATAELRVTLGRDAFGEAFAEIRLYRELETDSRSDLQLTATAAGVRIPRRLAGAVAAALRALEAE